MGGTESGKWGFINKDGKIVVEPQFAGVGQFMEGLAVVAVQQDSK